MIARAVREANVYCEIVPFHSKIQFDPSLKGIILSGSPFSVNDPNAPDVDIQGFNEKVPVLGVCYGAQLTAKNSADALPRAINANMAARYSTKKADDVLLKDMIDASQVWMSHSDSVLELPTSFSVLGTTEDIPLPPSNRMQVPTRFTAYSSTQKCIISIEGKKLLKNFLVNICGVKQDWTPAHFVTDTINNLKSTDR